MSSFYSFIYVVYVCCFAFMIVYYFVFYGHGNFEHVIHPRDACVIVTCNNGNLFFYLPTKFSGM